MEQMVKPTIMVGFMTKNNKITGIEKFEYIDEMLLIMVEVELKKL